MKFTHCIVAKLPDGEIVHWAGFESEPSKEDFDGLHEEILTDEEFGLSIDKPSLTLSLADETEFEQFLVMVEAMDVDFEEEFKKAEKDENS